MTGLHLDADVGMKIAGIKIPRVQAVLVINERFRVHFDVPVPGRWHRFWYRLLLGWRWESVKKERKRKSVRIPHWLRALLFFAVGFLLTRLLLG